MPHDSVSTRRDPKFAPKTTGKEERNAPGIFAGWISEKHGIAWVVSPHRKDVTFVEKSGQVYDPAKDVKTYTLIYGPNDKRQKTEKIHAYDDMDAKRQAEEILLLEGVHKRLRELAQLKRYGKEIPLWTVPNENAAAAR